MNQPCCNGKYLHRDLLQASNHLKWWTDKPEQALELMQPYANCLCFEGLEEAKYRRIIGLVYSMMGDCCRAMKQIETAAEWYEKATLKSDFRGSGKIYADMVIAHRLSKHYVTALQSFRGEITWEAKNFDWPARLKYAKVVLARGAWLEPDFWRLNLRKRTLLRRLENLVAAQERGETN